MATNPPTVEYLKKMTVLIDQLGDTVDQIKAWNRLLKKHLAQHKRQENPFTGHKYKYIKKKKKLRRSGGGVKTVEY
jgi:hypothetical protein